MKIDLAEEEIEPLRRMIDGTCKRYRVLYTTLPRGFLRMNRRMKKMDEIHLFTSEQKLKWWGYGEWVEEPDAVNFEHEGVKCYVRRVAIQEPCTKEFHMFGGHLCGYCLVPKDHPDHGKEGVLDNTIDVHGGITFCELSENKHCIGFDCGHWLDYMPSIEFLRNTPREFEEMKKIIFNFINKLPRPRRMPDLFETTYRNIQFCIDQCKSMAEQINQRKGNGHVHSDTP